MQRFAASTAALVAFASAAAAHQEAYVVSREERTVHVVDVATGLEIPGREFRTNGDPQGLAIARSGDLYVAAKDEATIHLSNARADRIDLHFHQAGVDSIDVAYVETTDTLYVLQDGSLASSQAVLVEVPLHGATIDACIANLTKDCYLGSQDSALHPLPLNDPRFVVASPRTGAIFAVGGTGDVAVFVPATGSATPLSFGTSPLPASPGGMAAAPDGRIAISGNGPGGPALTLVTPGSPARIETVALPLSEAGGVRFDPRLRPDGYPVVVGDAAASRIVEVRKGRAGTPRSIGSSGAHPTDLVVNHRGVVVTANENSTATTVFPASSVTRPLDPVLVAVELDRPREDPHIAARPYELGWTYGPSYQYLGAQRITIENLGGGSLVVSGVSVAGFDRANFDVVNDNCTGRVLAQALTCTVDVDFRAGGYTGLRLNTHTYRASLRVDSNDDPLFLPLVGEHVTAALRERLVKIQPTFQLRLGD